MKELSIEQYNLPLLCPDCFHIEDEIHFLLNCVRYSTLRRTLYDLPFLDNITFCNANSDDKIMFILNCLCSCTYVYFTDFICLYFYCVRFMCV